MVTCFVACLVVGFIAYSRVPVALMPTGMQGPWLGLQVSYSNASPAEVERRIARPVERIVRTMQGVESVYSNSGSGGCWLNVRFRSNTDMSEAYNQLRDRCDRILAELPSDVKRVTIRKFGMGDLPVLFIDFAAHGVRGDVNAIIEEHVKRPLEAVDGVANVNVRGTVASRVQIRLSRARMNAHRVDMRGLVQQMRADNFVVSSGWVDEGSRKLYVRSDSRYASVEEISDLPLAGHPGLALRDVASVEYAMPEKEWEFRLNGAKGLFVQVQKQASSNIVEVTRRAIDALNNDIMKRPQMRGFDADVLFDQGEYIDGQLDQLRSAGLWGGLFAVFVLYFFLRRVRTTFVIAGAIPLSIMMSLTAIYFSGWSLNVLTTMGLIIAFGMVVDNSIVVTEAIHARRSEGLDSYRASVLGASEVGLAITVSTMTTLVVFLPLILMSGNQIVSYFMARLGMPVVYALLASLLVALLFIPLAMRHLMSRRPPAEARAITVSNAVYQKALRWVMAHRLETALISLLLFATIAIPIGKIGSGGGGDSILSQMYVRYNMPNHYTLADADSIMSQYETFMLERRDTYGLKAVGVNFRRDRGTVWAVLNRDERAWYTVALHKMSDRLGFERRSPMAAEEMYDDIREHAPRFPGVEMSIDRQQDDTQRTSVTLFGSDTIVLERLAREVERRLRLLAQVTEVDSDVENARTEIQLRVDRQLAQRLGVDTGTIASAVSSAMRGASLTRFHGEDREVDISLELDKEDRRTLDDVLNLAVTVPGGANTTVRSVVGVAHGEALRSIHRENGRTRMRVTAISSDPQVKRLRTHVMRALQDLEMPRGYQWTLSGRFESIAEQRSEMMFAVVLAVAFVFLLMGILFESFILPLSVIISIPFSFFGVFWMLYLTGTPLDAMGAVGMIVLIGVVVNNAIVLVDLVNRLRADGRERIEAIVEAGAHRFRPILLTSATTIFGLLPVTLGNSEMIGIPYNGLGVVIIGGLAASTLLTLFVVPLFYSLFDDLRTTASNMISCAVRGPGREQPASMRPPLDPGNAQH